MKPQPPMQVQQERQTNDIDPTPVPVPVPVPTKRRRRGSCFFKSALVILRGGGRGGSKKTASKDSSTTTSPNVPSKDQWKNVVDGMRPLHHHHQEQQHSPLANHAPVGSPSSSWSSALDSSSSSSKSNDTMSQYASTQNLQDLDTSEAHTCKVLVEEDLEEDDHDGYPADEMIDAKADQFIANFYHQMRIQQLKDEKRYNKKLQKLSR